MRVYVSRKIILFFVFLLVLSSIVHFHSCIFHSFFCFHSVLLKHEKLKVDQKKAQAIQLERQTHIRNYCQQHKKVEIFLDYNNLNHKKNLNDSQNRNNNPPKTIQQLHYQTKSKRLDSLSSIIKKKLKIISGNSSLNPKVVSHRTHKGHGVKYLLPRDFNALFYNDEHKVIYCEVPKVACTNWKRAMLHLSGKVHVTNLQDIPANQVHSNLSHLLLKRMSILSVKEIVSRIDTSSGYFKFMFVREPFERLLSAYRNKFASHYSKYFHDKYGKDIVTKYRSTKKKNASMQNLGKDVKFAEFVSFLINQDEEKVMRREMNPHWKPISQLCHPCTISYDWVGKHGTMEAWEADLVLRRLNMTNFTFPPAYTSGLLSTVNALESSYKRLNRRQVGALKELYQQDLSMFYPEEGVYGRLMRVV